MGNKQTIIPPESHRSDREIARQLIESKRLRSVHFSDSIGGSSAPKSSRSEDGSDGESPSLRAKDLRSNLMRQQKDRDPLFYYEIVKVLGVGSMGSVAMVRKRDETIGGSARRKLVDTIKRQKRNDDCYKIPVLGDCFRYCMENQEERSSSHGDIFEESLRTDHSYDGNESSRSTTSLHKAVTYALKSIHLNRVQDKVFIDELKNEIEILKSLDHPHIVRPIETFVHRNQLFIVMELCSGGDLYSRDPYTEDEAARIVESILSAVAFMHEKKIVHRDLKYENILFANETQQSEIKLIDFGLSKMYASDKELTEGVGTIYTMAPEVLKGTYTSQADLWSVGVIAYMLLSSQMPFYGRKRSHIVEQIMQCKYDFKGRRWKRVSPQARTFVEDLLVLDPEDRVTANEALQSSWLNKRYAATVRAPTIEEVDTTANTIKKYSTYSHLKKLALMVIAHKSTSSEIGILRKVFQQYDKNKDGTIQLEDFQDALGRYGYPPEEISRMFDAVDLDGTGRIRYTEFLAATIEAHGAIDEERLAEAFDRLDSDDSGFISAENLQELLGPEYPAERIKEIIREADLTDDNRISYPEFLALWEEKGEEEREEMYSSLRQASDSSTEYDQKAKEVSQQKELMRQDSDSEHRTIARVNFLEGKQLSERRAQEALQIEAKNATKVVLNTIEEVVDDPEASDHGAIIPGTDDPLQYVRLRVCRKYGDSRYFGSVTSYDEDVQYWNIKFDDGDEDTFDKFTLMTAISMYESSKKFDPSMQSLLGSPVPPSTNNGNRAASRKPDRRVVDI